jgi:hypothetical protein
MINIIPKTFIPHSIFWLEVIMLWAFGFSWLVKGETILRDKNTHQPVTTS